MVCFHFETKKLCKILIILLLQQITGITGVLFMMTD